jgi:cyclopropane fatty-acyl-phospholipid synthase-like methyltransferase
LEDRGRHPFFNHVINEYVTELALDGAEALLDLGCGTGIAARAIARHQEVSGP